MEVDAMSAGQYYLPMQSFSERIVVFLRMVILAEEKMFVYLVQ